MLENLLCSLVADNVCKNTQSKNPPKCFCSQHKYFSSCWHTEVNIFILPQRHYLYVVTPQMSNIFVFTLSLRGVGVPRSSFYSFEMNTQSRDEPKRESQGISRLILVIVPCLRGDPDSQHFFFFFSLIHPSFYLLCQFVPG